MIKSEDMKMVSKVADFMENLYKVDPARYNAATRYDIPHGDLAYGAALVDWIKKAKPKNAIFSYAEGQYECMLLMAFAKEISEEFGLPILTRDEAKTWRSMQANIKDHKVVDWLN